MRARPCRMEARPLRIGARPHLLFASKKRNNLRTLFNCKFVAATTTADWKLNKDRNIIFLNE